MYRRTADFLSRWDYETETTLKVFGNLTDGALHQKVYPEGRSLGRLAWHIVQTLPEMCGRTGLDVTGPGEDEPVPDSVEVITEAFREAAASLGEQVRTRWTDADLEVHDEMYGEMWPRGATLSAVVFHQAHHRGQMTVLMRQAGLRVPGVYGPSREEWDTYGMPAPE
jgi:uncharacterized damage-inducible protein DinB